MQDFQQLPQIHSIEISGQPDQAVDGRDVHVALGIATPYADWIRRKIQGYGFAEGVDFISRRKVAPRANGAAVAIEHLLTLDMAKEVAMTERNEKGRQIRRYFIEVEKKARETSQFVHAVPGRQGVLFPDERPVVAVLPGVLAEARALMLDVALQAGRSSKVARLMRLLKPVVFGQVPQLREKGGMAS